MRFLERGFEYNGLVMSYAHITRIGGFCDGAYAYISLVNDPDSWKICMTSAEYDELIERVFGKEK